MIIHRFSQNGMDGHESPLHSHPSNIDVPNLVNVQACMAFYMIMCHIWIVNFNAYA